MALILSLETSTGICSVALHENSRLLVNAEVQQEQAHASQLALLIQDVMEKAKITPKEISAVAISSGPGSYTGLRIGTSTAKGFCYSLNIPLVSIPTLDLIAKEAVEKIAEPSALFVPMIDAKRMEVYARVTDSDLGERMQTAAVVVDENSFRELLEGNKMFFCGDGAEKCKSVFKHPNANFIDGILPRAQTLGFMAFRKFEKKAFEDLVNFKPFYLKEFIAKKAQSVF
jgi:tRNA threonylcarbamoyladenosine biosynthesis protein TsaB